jgi:predicted kinase
MSSVKVRTNKPLLIILYGFPGAGKTNFAHNLTDSLDCAHVHGDRIRYELFEEPRYDEQEEGIIKQLMDYMTEEFLKAGISVIYDANMSRKADRHEIRELARKKHAKTLMVWFQLDPDTAYNRIKNRDRRKTEDKYAFDYTESEFRQYASRMQHPMPTEDYVVVSGKHTFPSQKSSVIKKFMEMGLVSTDTARANVAKPGMVNLIPNTQAGRVDMSRRNINIH